MKLRYRFTAILSFILFLYVLFLVHQNKMEIFDEKFFHWFEKATFIEPFAILGTESIIAGGSIILIVFLWLKKKDYNGILTVVVAVGGANVINKLLKRFEERPRPPFAHGEDGFSFPSGHAMVGIVFSLILAYYITKEVKRTNRRIFIWVFATVLAFLSGVSRIVQKAHYSSDVFAGFLLGYSFFILCLFLYEKAPRDRKI